VGAGRVVDLGRLAAGRGTEMFLVLWWSITKALGTYELNVAVQRA
jgi:hypothetical protein